MREFERKRHIKHFIFSAPFLVVYALVAAFFISAAWGMYKKASVAYNNMVIADRTQTDLKNRERELSLRIADLETAPGREREFRKMYGLALPGEEVVLVVDAEEDAATIAPSDSYSWWDRVRAWFQ